MSASELSSHFPRSVSFCSVGNTNYAKSTPHQIQQANDNLTIRILPEPSIGHFQLFRGGTMSRQILAFVLAFIMMGTTMICALPMWKVPAFVRANIVIAQVLRKWLWMNCRIQSIGHMQSLHFSSCLCPRT